MASHQPLGGAPRHRRRSWLHTATSRPLPRLAPSGARSRGQLCPPQEAEQPSTKSGLTRTGAPAPRHLLLELHTDGVGLLEEDGIAPEQVPQRRELVPLPLAEGPQSQLALALCPLDCGERPRGRRGDITTPPLCPQAGGSVSEPSASRQLLWELGKEQSDRAETGHRVLRTPQGGQHIRPPWRPEAP